MKLAKLALLSATVLAGTIANSAQAQVADPGAELHGIGATSIQIVLQQELNCLSGNNPTYNSAGTPISVVEANYQSATKPLNCATTAAQPADSGVYVGVGSGSGRKAWENFTGFSAFKDGRAPWSHEHFAFSDGAISPSDINAFRAGAANNAVGNPLQIPLFVLPVAVAYNGVYGHDNNKGVDLAFAVKSTYANANGGLRMSRNTYCGIFNGTITNWNAAALKADNGGQSLMDPNDSATRWAAEGAPIRLVGRADSSGTTDIFARHLAAVCGADVDAGGSNHYQQHAGGLPYDGSVNLLPVDTNTTYKGAWAAGSFANSTNDAAHNMISGAYFDGTSIVTTQGSEQAGKYLLADGSTKLAAAISLAPDVASSTAGVFLNGKVGYIGTDYVNGLNGSTLKAAALPQNNTTTFLMPNAKNGALALTQLPPQSTSNGTYNALDARTVVNPVTGTAETVDRANPLHWTAVLYADSANTLANPAKGYPITGTTQFLPYQCYASANTRIALANLVGMITGKATKEDLAIYDPTTFTNTSTTAPGVTAAAGIAPMPAAWNTAIAATFLSNSTSASNGNILGQVVVSWDATRQGYYTTAGTGGHGMWIQSALPTATSKIPALTSNGACTAGQGA